MSKYKFTKAGRSYATGQTWAAGQTVPDSFSIGMVETMLKDGTIVEIKPEKAAKALPEEKEMKVPTEQKEPEDPAKEAAND